VLRSVAHDFEHSTNKVERDARVKQIAHRVHEYKSRLPPLIGKLEAIRVKSNSEARTACPGVTVQLVLGVPHSLQALGERQGIAVVTAGRDTIAARRWVPGCFRPLNRTPIRHALTIAGISPTRTDVRIGVSPRHERKGRSSRENTCAS
jgi:hypothetical protein